MLLHYNPHILKNFIRTHKYLPDSGSLMESDNHQNIDPMHRFGHHYFLFISFPLIIQQLHYFHGALGPHILAKFTRPGSSFLTPLFHQSLRGW